jgi:hypothetical protein
MVAQVFGVKKGNPVLLPEFTIITNSTVPEFTLLSKHLD